MSQQVDRTLDILELHAASPDGLPLSETAAKLGLSKSAAHRLLSQLVDRGYLQQEPVSQRYKLTLRLLVLGFRYLTNIGLNDVCQPELDRLAEMTGELVRLAIVDGESLTWVAEAQGARHGLKYDGNFGNTVCLPATATGKSWLATLPDEEAIRIVRASGFGDPAIIGAKAVRTVPALVTELARTRQQGYGLAWEEGEPGMAAIAVAIPGPGAGSSYVGTLSVAGPTVRTTPERLEAVAPELHQVAKRLSELWPIRQHQTGDQRRPTVAGGQSA